MLGLGMNRGMRCEKVDHWDLAGKSVRITYLRLCVCMCGKIAKHWVDFFFKWLYSDSLPLHRFVPTFVDEVGHQQRLTEMVIHRPKCALRRKGGTSKLKIYSNIYTYI